MEVLVKVVGFLKVYDKVFSVDFSLFNKVLVELVKVFFFGSILYFIGYRYSAFEQLLVFYLQCVYFDIRGSKGIEFLIGQDGYEWILFFLYSSYIEKKSLCSFVGGIQDQFSKERKIRLVDDRFLGLGYQSLSSFLYGEVDGYFLERGFQDLNRVGSELVIQQFFVFDSFI